MGLWLPSVEEAKGFFQACIPEGQGDSGTEGSSAVKEKDFLSELSEMRRAFDEFFVSKNPLMMISDPYWRPPMDVFDTAEYTLVRVEVAGMVKEDIEINLDGDRLIIRGHRRNRHDEKLPARCYRQMEIKYTTFQRELLLLRPFHENQIEATYQNGFLEVKIPARKKRTRPAKVKIEIPESA